MGLDGIELVMAIEKFFNIQIPDQEAEKMTTIGHIVHTVARHLNITNEETALRDRIFSDIKAGLEAITGRKQEFELTDKLGLLLTEENKAVLPELENQCRLKIPWPGSYFMEGSKVIKWLLNKTEEKKLREWNTYDFSEFTDAVCGCNYDLLINPKVINSKHEIFIAVMGITADQVGVDYYEISPEKSITDDLGVE
jgi:hypothetical protein